MRAAATSVCCCCCCCSYLGPCFKQWSMLFAYHTNKMADRSRLAFSLSSRTHSIWDKMNNDVDDDLFVALSFALFYASLVTPSDYCLRIFFTLVSFFIIMCTVHIKCKFNKKKREEKKQKNNTDRKRKVHFLHIRCGACVCKRFRHLTCIVHSSEFSI